MHPMHPALTQNLAEARVVELQRLARRSSRAPHVRRRHFAMRENTGWFLVNLGLRIAMSRRQVAAVSR